MKMTDEQMIEVGDFVTICTNGNDFLGDKSMFDGMVGEVLEINGAIKPVYKVRVIRIAPPDTPGFSYGEEGGASLLS